MIIQASIPTLPSLLSIVFQVQKVKIILLSDYLQL